MCIRDRGVANQLFAAILMAMFQAKIEQGALSLEYETSGGDPYYDLAVMVDVTGYRFCIPRPLLAIWVYKEFIEIAEVVGRLEHNREHRSDKLDFQMALKMLLHRHDLEVPPGYLLEEGDSWIEAESGSNDGDWEDPDHYNDLLALSLIHI